MARPKTNRRRSSPPTTAAAGRQLAGVLGLDSRNRGTTYMSASNLLAAYRYPEVLATARPGFTPAQLLDGGASTLYIAASSRRERSASPLLGDCFPRGPFVLHDDPALHDCARLQED